MDANELINSMKQIIHCYESVQPGSPLNREIMMWRRKFIESQPICHTGLFDYSAHCFMSEPSYNILKNGPEEVYQTIKDCYEKDTNK